MGCSQYFSAFLLDNGAMYHIAHGAALTEYLLSLYFAPSWKAFADVSTTGELPIQLSHREACTEDYIH